MITTRKSSCFPRGRLLRLHVIVFVRCANLASTYNGTLCTSEHDACPEDMLILVNRGFALSVTDLLVFRSILVGQKLVAMLAV
jgi:hypothetical protein